MYLLTIQEGITQQTFFLKHMSYALTSEDYWMFITVTEFKISYFNLHIFKQVFLWLHVGVIKEYYFSHKFHDFFFHLVVSVLNLGTLGPVFNLPQFLCPGVRF